MLPARSSSIVDLTAAVVESAQNDRYRHSVLLKFSRSACSNLPRRIFVSLHEFDALRGYVYDSQHCVCFFFFLFFFCAVKIGLIVHELSEFFCVIFRRISLSFEDQRELSTQFVYNR